MLKRWQVVESSSNPTVSGVCASLTMGSCPSKWDRSVYEGPLRGHRVHTTVRVCVCQIRKVQALSCLSVVSCVFPLCMCEYERENWLLWTCVFVGVCFLVWICVVCVYVCVDSIHCQRLITLFSLAKTDRSSFRLKVPVYFSSSPAYAFNFKHSVAQMKQLFIYVKNKGTAWCCFWQPVLISIAPLLLIQL